MIITMTKKIFFGSFLLLILSLSPVFAQELINDTTSDSADTAQLIDREPFFFVNLSGGIFNYHLPPFDVNTFNSNESITSLRGNSIDHVPLYRLGIGYNYVNYEDSFLNGLLGFEKVVELDITYFNQKEDSIYWKNNAGDYGFKLKADHMFLEGSLYVKGKKYLNDNNSVWINPYFGVEYIYLAEDYDYTVTQLASGKFNYNPYELTTNYGGVIAGIKFNVQLAEQIIPFIDLELQGLVARSTLRLHDTKFNNNDFPVDFIDPDDHSDKIELTYRAKASAGVEVKFSNKPDASKVSISGGVDRLGYQPGISVPKAPGEKSSIISDAVTNPFVLLSLIITI